MKNIVSTVIVFGSIFILILVGAFLFNKMRGLDSLREADSVINGDLREIMKKAEDAPVVQELEKGTEKEGASVSQNSRAGNIEKMQTSGENDGKGGALLDNGSSGELEDAAVENRALEPLSDNKTDAGFPGAERAEEKSPTNLQKDNKSEGDPVKSNSDNFSFSPSSLKISEGGSSPILFAGISEEPRPSEAGENLAKGLGSGEEYFKEGSSSSEEVNGAEKFAKTSKWAESVTDAFDKIGKRIENAVGSDAVKDAAENTRNKLDDIFSSALNEDNSSLRLSDNETLKNRQEK